MGKEQKSQNAQGGPLKDGKLRRDPFEDPPKEPKQDKKPKK